MLCQFAGICTCFVAVCDMVMFRWVRIRSDSQYTMVSDTRLVCIIAVYTYTHTVYMHLRHSQCSFRPALLGEWYLVGFSTEVNRLLLFSSVGYV